MSHTSLKISEHEYIRYSRIGGWLLVFVIQSIMGIISGINDFMASSMNGAAPLNMALDSLPTIVMIITVILLFSRKKLFKVFFYIYTGFIVFSSVIMAIGENNYTFLVYCVTSVLWIIYFILSKRVKAYLENTAPINSIGKSL